MNVQVRPKPRVRLDHRDAHDRPVWHAVAPGTIATGATPYLAMHNLRNVLPTRRRP
jgi:hypothetical protein